MSFWETMWLILSMYLFIGYLVALFFIITDLFRDKELSGWWKALWFALLLFVPLLTAIIYLVSRGRGMAERTASARAEVKRESDEYIRSVAQVSPAEEIAKAQSLLEAGHISQQEYDILKAKALG
ncbi:hypothetical protein [Timonella sp. A28]|uniref:hypothetical protein n=1 Tax=Timonella sp. A28 TaxID=3442640 RepID=UPI003EBFED14